MEKFMKPQSGKELLKEAIEQWEKNAGWGSIEERGNRDDSSEDEAFFNNMRMDPVINLLMTALSYQTNMLKEQVSGLRNELLGELMRQMLPYHLTRPVPAVTIMQAHMKESTEPFVWADDATAIVMEKKAKTKMKFKEIDKFPFLPLFKTKVLNTSFTKVHRVNGNTFELSFSTPSSLQNLSGISLFFPNISLDSLSVSLNGVELPVVSIREYDQLPLCDSFEPSHSVFSRSLLYGSSESWLDSVAAFTGHLFYIGHYDSETTGETAYCLTLNTSRDVNLSDGEVLLNCFPIVNVEKCSISLSEEQPIKKIAIEKLSDMDTNSEGASHSSVSRHRLFLNLLAPVDNEYNADQITLRRFGSERYHVWQLVAQLEALIHKYSSDYYAFSEFANVQFDEKMDALRNQLNEEVWDKSENPFPKSGVYVMLNKKQWKTIKNSSLRLWVSYLLTDGKSANGILPGATLSLPLGFDNESKILCPTFGGRDEVSDNENVRAIAQYYNHTHDRLVTRADIKDYCIKELCTAHDLKSNQIEKVEIKSDVISGKHSVVVEIQLKQHPNMKLSDGRLDEMSTQLQQKIYMRSPGFVTYQVTFKLALKQ